MRMLLRAKSWVTTLSPSFIPLPVDGVWLFGFTLQNVRSGYEPETSNFIRNFLKPGMTFVDIGANKGVYTVLAARAGARVVAYEPDPYAFKITKRNIALNGVKDNVEIKNVAVSDRPGTAVLTVDFPGSGLNSIVAGHGRRDTASSACRDV